MASFKYDVVEPTFRDDIFYSPNSDRNCYVSQTKLSKAEMGSSLTPAPVGKKKKEKPAEPVDFNTSSDVVETL